jgi:hypothetical protein
MWTRIRVQDKTIHKLRNEGVATMFPHKTSRCPLNVTEIRRMLKLKLLYAEQNDLLLANIKQVDSGLVYISEQERKL